MSRPTVATLAAEVDALRAELDALRAHVDATTGVQYVRELTPPRPISTPIDFDAMAAKLNDLHAQYDESRDVWGPGRYL